VARMPSSHFAFQLNKIKVEYPLLSTT
jgi:hypothetical protein